MSCNTLGFCLGGGAGGEGFHTCCCPFSVLLEGKTTCASQAMGLSSRVILSPGKTFVPGSATWWVGGWVGG